MCYQKSLSYIVCKVWNEVHVKVPSFFLLIHLKEILTIFYEHIFNKLLFG